jgi:DNA-binding NtrC family response regulator
MIPMMNNPSVNSMSGGIGMDFDNKYHSLLFTSETPERIFSDLSYPSLRDAVENFEKRYIHQVLNLNQGQKGKTAEALNIDRKTLYIKMKKYGLF